MCQLRMLIVMMVLMLGVPQPAAAAGPELTVTAPKDGAVIDGSTVTISFITANIKLVPTTIPVTEAGKHPEANHPGEGHLHFVLDLQPLVVWEKADPYTFTNLPPGDHQLMVELVQNDHSSLSPSVMQHIRFRSGMPESLPVTGAGPTSYADTGSALVILGVLLVAAGALLLRRRRVA
jgi:LPXTG-motif cell wall-anchored protein